MVRWQIVILAYAGSIKYYIVYIFRLHWILFRVNWYSTHGRYYSVFVSTNWIKMRINNRKKRITNSRFHVNCGKIGVKHYIIHSVRSYLSNEISSFLRTLVYFKWIYGDDDCDSASLSNWFWTVFVSNCDSTWIQLCIFIENATICQDFTRPFCNRQHESRFAGWSLTIVAFSWIFSLTSTWNSRLIAWEKAVPDCQNRRWLLQSSAEA